MVHSEAACAETLFLETVSGTNHWLERDIGRRKMSWPTMPPRKKSLWDFDFRVILRQVLGCLDRNGYQLGQALLLGRLIGIWKD